MWLGTCPRQGTHACPYIPPTPTYTGWGGDYEQSQTGFLITLGGAPISWGLKFQTVVALSTWAADYVALSEATQHLVKTISTLDCLGVTTGKSIHCKNQATVSMATDNSLCKKMCYLLQAFFFVNNVIRSHNINTVWVSTSEQCANVLSKPLSGPLAAEARRQLAIKVCSWGGVMTRAIAQSSRNNKKIPLM
ncbi:hypothetical protein O181_104113 [Austropuccinia psidii MF-1]|uniref:Uncharacterized protein n=1 Tax=Austropuccinia psidii MF-1 TaxID=1389203 RepID=A0A9Q3JJJ1_9BASI|nr:hypothetical protein [Austropuccinia psidii MF-1]